MVDGYKYPQCHIILRHGLYCFIDSIVSQLNVTAHVYRIYTWIQLLKFLLQPPIFQAMAAEMKSLFIIIMVINPSLASRFVTQNSSNGVRCFISNDKYHISYSEEYHHCVIRCLHKGCMFFNYNVDGISCQFSDGPCLYFVLEEQYNLISFFPPAESCVQWIPAAGSDTSHMVSSSQCHGGSNGICYVGRLIFGSHILPGKYFADNGLIYTSLEGNMHRSDEKAVVTVVAGCQLGWMPHIAGSTLPTRAVAGGILASGTGSHLFVIRGQAGQYDYAMIGYYDQSTQKGYVEYLGVNVLTEMEMLVVV